MSNIDPNAETVRLAPIDRMLSRQLARQEALIALAEKTTDNLDSDLRKVLMTALTTKRNEIQRNIAALSAMDNNATAVLTAVATAKPREAPPVGVVSVIAEDFFARG